MDLSQDDSDDERALELSSLKAIFPELEIEGNGKFSAKLELLIAPAKPFPVTFLPLASSAPQGLSKPGPASEDDQRNLVTPEIRHLLYLPPLELNVDLPEGYPSTVPPEIELTSQDSWLPEDKLKELGGHAYELWSSLGQSQVLYDYVDYIQQAAEDGFGLVPKDHTPLQLQPKLQIALLDYDSKMRKVKFDQETFDCGVCLEPKKGAVCHRVSKCGHVFCVECLKDFYGNCISEGDISSVKCLNPDCEKQQNQVLHISKKRQRRKPDRTLDPNELLQIGLDQDTVQRYVRLKRKKALESDKSTVYCPRQWCQGPAKTSKKGQAPVRDDASSSGEDGEDESKSYDPNENDDRLPPPSERLAVCEDCNYAFCFVCKTGWHGEFARCFPRRQYELTAEEKASEDYLKKHSTCCPTCDARCQKTMGCNHMVCFKCNTHFCYLCSAWLDGDNPYKHFNTEWRPCYQRLWELEEGDEDVEGGAPAVAVPPPPQIIFEEEDNALPPPAPIPPQAEEPVPNRHQGAGGRQARIQQFLRMAADDQEDEWDSDETLSDDEEDDRWEIRR